MKIICLALCGRELACGVGDASVAGKGEARKVWSRTTHERGDPTPFPSAALSRCLGCLLAREEAEGSALQALEFPPRSLTSHHEAR